MTAIAYKDGIIATDTAAWHGDINVIRASRKIFRVRDGNLFAGCGKSSDVIAHVKWASSKSLCLPDPAEEGFEGLTVFADGTACFVGRSHLPGDAVEEFAAIGCCSDFLYGAMAAGASAEEAVRLAIKYCAFAGGEVQVERVER